MGPPWGVAKRLRVRSKNSSAGTFHMAKEWSKEDFWKPPEDGIQLSKLEYKKYHNVWRNWFNIFSIGKGSRVIEPTGKIILACKNGPIKKSSGPREEASRRRRTSIISHHSCPVKFHIRPMKNDTIVITQEKEHDHPVLLVEMKNPPLNVKQQVAEVAKVPLRPSQVKDILQRDNPDSEFMYLKTQSYSNMLYSARGNTSLVNEYKKLNSFEEDYAEA